MYRNIITTVGLIAYEKIVLYFLHLKLDSAINYKKK